MSGTEIDRWESARRVFLLVDEIGKIEAIKRLGIGPRTLSRWAFAGAPIMAGLAAAWFSCGGKVFGDLPEALSEAERVVGGRGALCRELGISMATLYRLKQCPKDDAALAALLSILAGDRIAGRAIRWGQKTGAKV